MSIRLEERKSVSFPFQLPGIFSESAEQIFHTGNLLKVEKVIVIKINDYNIK